MPSTFTVTPVGTGNHDPRLRVFRCGRLVDSFAVITQRYLILVDTQVNRETMQQVIDALSPERAERKPLLVINTHGDWDHVWGNALFLAPDGPYPAPVIGHRLTAERMRSSEAEMTLSHLRTENPGEYDSAEYWPPSLLFEGEMVIDGGDLTLHLFPTPGHQPDHISVWIPEIRTVLTGDAAELPNPYVAHPETLPQLRDSLRRLDDLHAETALYCHAPGITDPALIHHNALYFDELERRCRDYLSHHPMPDDLDAVPDPSALLGWPLEAMLPPIPIPGEAPSPFMHDTAIRGMLRWLQITDEGS